MNLEEKRRIRLGPNDYKRSRRARRADDIALATLSGVVFVTMSYVLCSL
jgi:hypothetical protein